MEDRYYTDEPMTEEEIEKVNKDCYRTIRETSCCMTCNYYKYKEPYWILKNNGMIDHIKEEHICTCFHVYTDEGLLKKFIIKPYNYCFFHKDDKEEEITGEEE